MSSAAAHAATACDYVFRWDQQNIEACIDHLKKQAESAKMELQTLQLENKILNSHVCILAGELLFRNGSQQVLEEIRADTCPPPRRPAKKPQTPPQKRP